MTFTQTVPVVSLVANPGGWTDDLGNTDSFNLTQALMAIDSHYLQSPATPSNASITFRLGAVQPPQAGTRAIHVAPFTDGGGDEIDFTINLRVHGSGALIQSFSVLNAPSTESDHVFTETVDPADWSNVDLELVANQPPVIVAGNTPEEFHGPFNSWHTLTPSNDTTGNTDTANIQAILNVLTPDRGTSPVLYLAAGNWYINRQWQAGIQIPAGQVQGLLGPMILGHSRSDTIVHWVGGQPVLPGGAGTQGAGLFRHNGVTQMRFGRLTFDGGHVANFGYMDAWDNTQNFFPSGIRIEDFGVINLNPNSGLTGFQSETLGLSLGPLGFGSSELSVFRCYFNFSTSGGPDSVAAMPYNFNALDLWFWDCQFIGMNMGIVDLTDSSNAAGDFCAQRCAFAVTERDFQIGNVGANYASRWNYGSRGWRHFEAAPLGNFTCGLTVQGCTLNPPSAGQVQLSIAGPVMLIDNKMAAKGPGDARTIYAVSAYNTDNSSGAEIGLGNHFADDQATTYFTSASTALHTVDDLFSVPYVDPGFPTMAPEPSAHPRTVREPASLTLGAVKTLIESAQPYEVHHIPYGNYDGSETINVPANTPLFIEGDGPWTRLRRIGGATGNPVFNFLLPSLAHLRDVAITGGGDDCVKTTGTSTGGVIHMEGCTDSNTPATGGLRAHNMGATIVDLLNCGIGNSSASGTPYGVSSEGNSVVHWVCGTTGSGQGPIYQVLSGGTLVACNVYGENGDNRPTILVAPNSNGTLVVDGGRLIGDSVNCDVSSFTGSVAICNISLATNHLDGTQGGTVVMGNNALFLGVTFPIGTAYSVGGATQYAILCPRQTVLNGSGTSNQLVEASAGVADIPGYIRDHLAPLRVVKPVDLTFTASVPSGHTQMMLIDVRTDGEAIAFNFTAV